jgi:hypothetical protein
MAGCTSGDVGNALRSLGLLQQEPSRRGSGAQQPPRQPNGTSTVSKASRKPKKAAGPGAVTVMPIPESAPRLDWERLLGWQPTAVHLYKDAEGRLLFAVARRDHGGGKDIRPLTLTREPDGSLKWALRAPEEPRPLYGLDRLAARPSAPVLVVEGEKTADAAAAVFDDHVAVTWSGGAGAVDKTNWAPLAGREVTLWPDNDEAGAAAMERVVVLLTSGNP